MGNFLITAGIVLVVIGVVFRLLSHTGLPLLPGDILIRRDHFTFYFPIVSSIIISIILTFIVNFFRK